MKKRYWFYVVLTGIGLGTCLGSSAGVILNLFDLNSLIVFIIGFILFIISIILYKFT